MNAGINANIIWYALVLVLVGSALFSRRFSMRSAFAMVLAWIAIFGVMLGILSYRREIGQTAGSIAGRVQSEVTGKANQRAQGQSLHIMMSEDGHFWADGDINGTQTRFLIDSGATITALSEDTARRAALNVDTSGPGVVMQTANGAIHAQRSSIAKLSVGPVSASDLGVVVSPAFGETNVLGMNFLSRLKSWRVENGEMVLQQ
ncbi:MAG: TIGR02281 family clan AA aspartic protease [Sphingobium sp.]